MPQINSSEELRDIILLLEVKQQEQARSVKEEFHLLYESLKPINLLKETLNKVTTMPEIKDNLADIVLGHASGFISRLLFVRGSHNPIKRLIGTALEYGVTNFISNNPDGLKSLISKGVHAITEKVKSMNEPKQKRSEYADIE